MGKLTALKIRSLAEPGRYPDGDGLYLEINRKGSGHWLLRAQFEGKRRDIGLGSLKGVSLADARDAAFEIRRKIAQGIDPVAERRKERLVIPTFREAARQVHEEHEKAWKNGKHQKQWIATLETYAFPKLGDRLVDDIEGPLIRDVLAPIWLIKPETACGSASGRCWTGLMRKGCERPRHRCARSPGDCPTSRRRTGISRPCRMPMSPLSL